MTTLKQQTVIRKPTPTARLSVLCNLSLLGLLTLGAHSVSADQQNVAYARVITAQPVYRQVEERNPQRHCWVETVREDYSRHSRNNGSSTVVGSVIGGAIGHAVGHGKKNKRVGTAVGALLGAAIGNDLGSDNRRRRHHHVEYRDIERCEIRENSSTFEQLVGYDITYQYNGQRYTTYMSEHPGDRLKVAVNVRPIGY